MNNPPMTYYERALIALIDSDMCKGYRDYLLGELKKLEKIEQIVDDTLKNPVVLTKDGVKAVFDIREVLNG